jgi:flavin-dependent dehydrogenase
MTGWEESARDALTLCDGSRIGVVGAGPAGSMFAFFVLEMSSLYGLKILVDLYDPRDFSVRGPAGCNMCGGIVSESLVQILAIEGIVLPPQVVQRGIDSYVLHTDVGSVRIDTPLEEKRIASVHRGGGPMGSREMDDSPWNSFDEYLQTLAVGRGAFLIRSAVKTIKNKGSKPEIIDAEGNRIDYDLLVIASGINSPLKEFTSSLDPTMKPPSQKKAGIREVFLGEEKIGPVLGSSMHTFMVNVPGMEFAAIIPKGDYASICLLGKNISRDSIDKFMESPTVRNLMPVDWQPREFQCRCLPKLAMGAASRPYADRVVFIGDAGNTRLYKDGIGAAYKTAKAAAAAVVLHGVGAISFRKYYVPVCRRLTIDNLIGRVVFFVASFIRHFKPAQRAVLWMTRQEQDNVGSSREMSTVLWDMFTGSAPYKEIFLRTLRPRFLWRTAMAFATTLFMWRRTGITYWQRQA